MKRSLDGCGTFRPNDEGTDEGTVICNDYRIVTSLRPILVRLLIDFYWKTAGSE